ncbi:MAG: hypothetical protein ACRD03_01640 [Acidimicrobiales bacterium]
MSEHQHDVPAAGGARLTIADLARQQRAQEVGDPKELAADVWESDEELDSFLADLRASRNASIA